MKEILGFKVDEVASALCMSPRTVERYVAKFQTLGDVKTETIGRPFNSVAMHSHVEFLIIEAVLEHPDKTLSETVHDVYAQTGPEFAVSTIFYYLRRNRFSSKTVCNLTFVLLP